MKRTLFRVGAVILLGAAGWSTDAGGPAIAAPAAVADAAQKGPYEIGFTSFVLTDPSRPGDGAVYTHRPIPVYVWYPVDPKAMTPAWPQALYPTDPLYAALPALPAEAWAPYGFDQAFQEPPPSADAPFPVVVISPGWGGSAWQHMPIATRLASHGFLVAVLYHTGDQFWPWEPSFDRLSVATFNRPRDVSFVLTDLLAKNDTAGHLLHGTMRPDQVAASGWSLGGYASIVLAGGDDGICDTLSVFDPDPPSWTCAPTSPDPRIKAIVPLDGSGWILHFDELARVKVPVMGLSQEWTGLMAQVEQGLLAPGFEAWAARQHAAYSGRPSYRVELFNSNHGSFGDVCDVYRLLVDQGVVPPEAVQPAIDAQCTPYMPSAVANRIITQYMVAFLKTNLARVPGYQAMLTPGWTLTREPDVEFFVTERRSPQSISDDWPDDFIYFIHQSGSAQARAAKEPARLMPVPRVSPVR